MVKNATISPKVKFECLQHLIVDQCPPEQISGTMKRKGVSVSHTTVDKWVVEDKAVGGALFNLRIKESPPAISPPGHQSKTARPRRSAEDSETGK